MAHYKDKEIRKCKECNSEFIARTDLEKEEYPAIYCSPKCEDLSLGKTLQKSPRFKINYTGLEYLGAD